MHIPVLSNEIIDGLELRQGDIVLDATVGFGGHSKEICARIGDRGSIIGIDMDEAALKESSRALIQCSSRIILEKSSFRKIKEILDKHKISSIDKAIFDLGLSSHQIEKSGRGFSFIKKDEPLIMTFSAAPPQGKLTAGDIVNDWSEEEIANVLFAYGDERAARRIAAEIIKERKHKKIETAGELADIILRSVPLFRRYGKIHPATKTFQALRVAVNDEYDALKEGLAAAFGALAQGGRIAVISFQSGEDRITKRQFLEWKKNALADILTKKPIRPSDEEIKNNPRARSAKLRIIQKI